MGKTIVPASALVWEAFGDQVEAEKYRVIYGDPAWKFSAGPSRNPSNHYKTMPLREIMALPIKALAHPDGARVILWVTVPHLRNGLRCFDAWGVRYSSARFWVKLWPKENGLFLYPDGFSRGTGYEIANDTEVLLIGKIRKPARAPKHKVRNAFFDPRRDHSQKPDQIRHWIEKTYDGPRCELFSRTDRKGWDHWGDERGKYHS